MAVLYLLRFFRVVPPAPRLMVVTWVVTVAAAAAAMALHPARAAGTLAPVLLLQLFAASSGFAVLARRGYYDLLLTHADARIRIALAHWSLSVSPGLASWMAIAAVEAAVRGAAGATLASGTIAAMLLVSTLPWALTAALPRFAGAIGWLLVLVLARMMVPEAPLPPAIESLVYPMSLVGRHLAREDFVTVLPAIGVALAAMVAACTWIHRTDIPLEAAQ